MASRYLRLLLKSASSLWPCDYTSELDTIPELNPDLANYYQLQISVLHWIVELGLVDIITEVSTLTSHMALPRLDAVFHIFAYLKKKHNTRTILDLSYPDISTSVSHDCDWRQYYGDVKEPLLLDVLKE